MFRCEPKFGFESRCGGGVVWWCGLHDVVCMIVCLNVRVPATAMASMQISCVLRPHCFHCIARRGSERPRYMYTDKQGLRSLALERTPRHPSRMKLISLRTKCRCLARIESCTGNFRSNFYSSVTQIPLKKPTLGGFFVDFWKSFWNPPRIHLPFSPKFTMVDSWVGPE